MKLLFVSLVLAIFIVNYSEGAGKIKKQKKTQKTHSSEVEPAIESIDSTYSSSVSENREHNFDHEVRTYDYNFDSFHPNQAESFNGFHPVKQERYLQQHELQQQLQQQPQHADTLMDVERSAIVDELIVSGAASSLPIRETSASENFNTRDDFRQFLAKLKTSIHEVHHPNLKNGFESYDVLAIADNIINKGLDSSYAKQENADMLPQQVISGHYYKRRFKKRFRLPNSVHDQESSKIVNDLIDSGAASSYPRELYASKHEKINDFHTHDLDEAQQFQKFLSKLTKESEGFPEYTISEKRLEFLKDVYGDRKMPLIEELFSGMISKEELATMTVTGFANTNGIPPPILNAVEKYMGETYIYPLNHNDFLITVKNYLGSIRTKLTKGRTRAVERKEITRL